MNSLIEYRHRFKLGILIKYQNNKMSDHRLSLKRIRLNREELNQLSKEEIITRWLDQEAYIDSLEAKRKQAHGEQNEELIGLRESEEKLKQQQIEATRRENVLVMRLTTKEQEMQEYANQIQELKQAQNPTTLQLRSALLDPAVNLLFQRMKKEVDDFKEKVEQTQNELSAWKFTPDSNTGKRLMAKCRLLYQENEEFGKMISSGRLAKLEGDLALQKNFSEEMKKSQKELDELLLELDEEVEGMQSTIYFYQQQVKEIKDQLHKVQEENKRLHNQQSVVPHSIEEKFSWTHEHNKTSQSSGTTNGAHVNHHCLQKLSDLDLKVDRTSSVTSTSSPPRSRTCDLSPKSTLNENNCNHQTVCNNNLKLENTECSAISQQSDSWNTFKLKHLRSNAGEGDSQTAEKTDDNKIGESGQSVMTNGLVDSPACIDQEQT